MISGRSLRFVYAVKKLHAAIFEGLSVMPPTLNNCKWCPQACPHSRRRICCRNGEKWPNMLLIAEIPWDFVCESKKKASDCSCSAVVHSGIFWFPGNVALLQKHEGIRKWRKGLKEKYGNVATSHIWQGHFRKHPFQLGSLTTCEHARHDHKQWYNLRGDCFPENYMWATLK